MLTIYLSLSYYKRINLGLWVPELCIRTFTQMIYRTYILYSRHQQMGPMMNRWCYSPLVIHTPFILRNGQIYGTVPTVPPTQMRWPFVWHLQVFRSSPNRRGGILRCCSNRPWNYTIFGIFHSPYMVKVTRVLFVWRYNVSVFFIDWQLVLNKMYAASTKKQQVLVAWLAKGHGFPSETWSFFFNAVVFPLLLP